MNLGSDPHYEGGYMIKLKIGLCPGHRPVELFDLLQRVFASECKFRTKWRNIQE